MVKRKFTNDKDRLDAIKEQFLAFANLNDIHQDWRNLPFWYVDLHTAWLSQQDKVHSKELYELSNFKQVEDEIINIVKNKGAFYQYKTFIDNIYAGIWNTREKLTEQVNNYKKTLPLTDSNKKKLEKLKREIRRINRKELKNFIDTNYSIFRVIRGYYAANGCVVFFLVLHSNNFCKYIRIRLYIRLSTYE